MPGSILQCIAASSIGIAGEQTADVLNWLDDDEDNCNYDEDDDDGDDEDYDDTDNDDDPSE